MHREGEGWVEHGREDVHKGHLEEDRAKQIGALVDQGGDLKWNHYTRYNHYVQNEPSTYSGTIPSGTHRLSARSLKDASF